MRHITEFLLQDNKPRKMKIVLLWNEVQNQSNDPQLLIVSHSLPDWATVVLCSLAGNHLQAEV